jgi:opacity protein-like surface antigen
MFLWGIEGDWSSFRNSDSHSFSSSFDEGGGVTFSQTFNQSLSYSSLWSVRGRFGAVLSGVYHVYATAGFGGATTNYAYAASFSEVGGGPCVCAAIARTIAISPTGFVLGVGAEWKLWSNLVVGAEYLYYALASDTIVPFTTASLDPLIALAAHVHINNVNVVRARASWLFNLSL